MWPIFILYDDNLEAVWAIPAERKGAVQFVVSWRVSVLEISDYSNSDITLKSDQEPAMLNLMSTIAAYGAGNTATIDLPVRESPANGGVNIAVCGWQGYQYADRMRCAGAGGWRTVP